MFSKLYSSFNSGGCFINADQVQGESQGIDKFYRQKWVEQIRKLGTTQEELDAAFVRMKADKLAPLSAQLKWMKDAGFEDVNCWFKHYSFAVYSGIKL